MCLENWRWGGITERGLGVWPPLEKMEWPRRQHDSTGQRGLAHTGDVPAVSDSLGLEGQGRGQRQQRPGLEQHCSLSYAAGKMNSIAILGLRKGRSQGEALSQYQKYYSSTPLLI